MNQATVYVPASTPFADIVIAYCFKCFVYLFSKPHQAIYA